MTNGPLYTSGARGRSAYEVWLLEGNVGTVQDFFDSLGSRTFIHNQIASSKDWVITHNLNKQYPSVTIVDVLNRVVVGNIEYLSTSQIKVSFAGEFSGKAYLN